MSLKFTLGCDPEVFLEDKGTAAFHNAYDGTVKGNKAAPEATGYGAIQIDGMAVEFNTNPTTSIKEFSRLIGAGLMDIKKRWPKQQFMRKSVVHFTDEFLKAQPEECLVLGCDPDYDPYNKGLPNKTPQMRKPMRTAGGHIHVGWTEDADINDPEHIAMCQEVAKDFDWSLNNWALDVDRAGKERARMYGHLGAYRVKSYGVEYRTLSNFWIFEPAYRKKIAALALANLRMLSNNSSLSNHLLGSFRGVYIDGYRSYYNPVPHLELYMTDEEKEYVAAV